jgi:uncharacterized protein (DUF302 family)
MINLFKKTIIRISFEALLIQLRTELDKEGFVISGITDFQKEIQDRLNGHFKKYQILSVHIPYLSQQMLSLSPTEGVVLPCYITVIELQPGVVEVIPVNTSEVIAREMHEASLQNLAEEVSRRLDRVVHMVEHGPTKTPDLFTSWG